jgi:hypothetical protein
MMPPKAKAKDKGKAPQTQPTKPESPKTSAKLMPSAILVAKPVQSWYEAVIEEEEPTKPNRSNPTQFNIGLTPYPNHQNYSWHYKKCPNRPLTTPYLQQVVFPNPFQNPKEVFLLQNPKEVFLLQNPSFLYNTPVFQKPNPNIF